jgi:hypothetical protein
MKRVENEVKQKKRRRKIPIAEELIEKQKLFFGNTSHHIMQLIS